MAQYTKMQPKLLNVNRVPSQPKRRKKITLVFDEQKRREFLTGFHKRKLQRRQKAKEEFQQQLKQERKKIKHEARERFKKSLSNRDIPEIQQLLTQHEYETEGHTVSILELNVADLTENNALIGENKGTDEVENNEQEEDNDKCSENNEEIVGMSLDQRKKSKNSEKIKKETQVDNKKDLKKAIKKAALKQVKKSKVFQQKQRLERQKNRKESMKKRKRMEKAQKRSGKLKKKLNH
ncbi:PREDICTED: nucleolar protein 12 [Habropoda laboriosa]|uniref:nucleolar protein 12 n=1 Tax=Habropoda laboriosa TaxID=597456 RepID=UPI00083E565B|nr:PREDICTED: nucleolar protein 12 [Habropoda laboriosa]XP_017791072.1 PREDICTED: nucleolar protein 12 [Habropoda laboriosa]